MLPLRSRRPASHARAHVVHPSATEIQLFDANVDPFNHQRHDARLLGREQLVAQRVELPQRRAGVGFGDVAVLLLSRLPRPRHDLGLAKHRGLPVDDHCPEVARRNVPDPS